MFSMHPKQFLSNDNIKNSVHFLRTTAEWLQSIPTSYTKTETKGGHMQEGGSTTKEARGRREAREGGRGRGDGGREKEEGGRKEES